MTRAALSKTIRYLVEDGYYSKLKWIDGVTALELDVIGKLRAVQSNNIGKNREPI